MKDNRIDLENYREQSDEALQSLQKAYLEPRMSEGQLSRLNMRIEDAKRENRKDRKRMQIRRLATTAAALVIAFTALPNMSPAIAYAMEQMPIIGSFVKVVTFRDYEYEDEQHQANVKVPELMVDAASQNNQFQHVLGNTTDEINTEIQKITGDLLDEFTNHVRDELGYEELIVNSEIILTTQQYFTLKLICYQGKASGYERNDYYTIDLASGERLQLKDLFKEGADYITPVSENIMEQMRSQMAKDENVSYWLDDEMEELNFKEITEGTSFYINENDHVVISFNEGDVAPMYMGIVEFEIPEEVLADIRK